MAEMEPFKIGDVPEASDESLSSLEAFSLEPVQKPARIDAVVQDVSPDQAAELTGLSEISGIHPDLIKDNVDEVKKNYNSNTMDADFFNSLAPKMAKHLSQNSLDYAMAKDDKSLPEIEQLAGEVSELRKLKDTLYSGLAGANSLAVKGALGVYNLAAVPQNLIADALDIPSMKANIKFENQITKYYDEQSQIASSGVPELNSSITDEIMAGNIAKAARSAIYQGIQAAPSSFLIGMGAMSGPLAMNASLGLAGSAAATDKAKEYQDAGMSPERAVLQGIPSGVYEAGFESLALGKIFGTWGKAIEKSFGAQTRRAWAKEISKGLLFSFAQEGAEEAATSLSNDLTDNIAGITNYSAKDMATRLIDSGIVGGFGGAIGIGAPVGASAIYTARLRQQNAIERDFYTAIGDKAMQSKLKERHGGKFRAAVDAAVKDGPVENVYVDAEAIQTLYQDEKKLVEFLDKVGIQDEFTRALETDGRVKVSTGTWAATVAGTEEYKTLADHITFDVDGFTNSEINKIKEVQAAKPEDQAQIMEGLSKIQDNTDKYTVAKQVRKMLEDIGMPKEQAAQSSVIYRFENIMRERTPTAGELFDRVTLNITNDKTGKTATMAGPQAGQSVSQPAEPMSREQAIENLMLAAQTMDSTETALVGEEGSQNRIRVPPALFGPQFLLDAKKRYGYTKAEMQTATKNAASGKKLTKKQSEIVENLLAMSPDTERKPLDPEDFLLQSLPESIEVDGVMRPTLNSDGKPIANSAEKIQNFWRWFGDSKVVDEQGRPLVVYHGTNINFDTFNVKGRGKTTNAGAFYSNSANVAATYAGYDNAIIMPVYLRINDPFIVDANGSYWRQIDDSAVVILKDGTQDDLGSYFNVNLSKEGGETVSTDDISVLGKKLKKDGAIVENVIDRGPFAPKYVDVQDASKPNKIFTIYDQTSVKSATGNQGAFDPSNPNILFQSQTTNQNGKELFIQHNLTADNLIFADKMGGLAAPSLAITKASEPMDNFGEITLIGPSEMATPKGATKVYGADVYSPRYPDVKWVLKSKDQDKLKDFFKEELTQTDSTINYQELSKGPDHLQNEPFAMVKFLKSQGIEPNIQYETATQQEIDEVQNYGLSKYLGIQDYNLVSDAEFIDDAISAQKQQWKETYDKETYEEVSTELDKNDGYRRRIVREWARTVDNVFKLKDKPKFDYTGSRNELRTQIKDAGLSDNFYSYLNSVLMELNPKQKIPKETEFETKWIDHTLENVVKVLKQNIRGGEGFNYGVGSIRSKFAKQFKSIKEISKNKNKLVKKEDFEKIKEKTTKVFFEIANSLKKFHPASDSFRYYDAVSSMMIDSANFGVPKSLIENGFNNVSSESIDEIASFLDGLSDMETEYFEVKITRPVLINEFVAAVIPKNSSKKVKDILLKNNLKIYEYEENRKLAFDDAVKEIGSNILFQGDKDSARGMLVTDQTKKVFNMFLKKNQDLTTFIHESAHLFLYMWDDIGNNPNTSAEVKADYQKIRDYLGLEYGQAIGVSHQEKFAEAFEKYIGEGKAPTSELRQAFAVMKSWFIKVYRAIEAMYKGVKLNDEIRGVFDRMIATEAEIERARDDIQSDPLFKEATNIMKPDEFERYKKAIDAERERAEELIWAEAMKDYTREQQSAKSKRKKELNELFESMAKESPKFKPYYALTEGVTKADGTVTKVKLDRKEVESVYGKDITKTIPKGVFGKDAIGLDVAAITFMGVGASGNDLVKVLSENPNPKTEIEKQVQEMIDSEFGDPIADGTIAEMADKAVHNLDGTKRRIMELEALMANKPGTYNKAAGIIARRRLVTEEQFRRRAELTLNGMKINDIKPSRFKRAEAKAGNEAFKAFQSGDMELAIQLKQKEILNFELYRLSITANDEIEKSLTKFNKAFASDEKLTKTRSLQFVQAARAMLAKFGLGEDDMLPEDYLKQLKKYDEDGYIEAVAQYEAVTVDQKNFKDFNFAEFVSLKEAFDTLWSLARTDKQIEVDGKKIDKQIAIDEIMAELETMNPTKTRKQLGAMTKKEEFEAKILSAKNMLTRVEAWADFYGEKTKKYIHGRISNAATDYRLDRAKYAKKIKELSEKHAKTIDAKKKIATSLPGMDGFFDSKYELIGALLHTGNESNLKKLLVGNGWGTINEDKTLDTSKWDQEFLTMQKNGTITKADMDFVQQVWDTLEEIKPAAQKAHKSIYGFFFSEVTSKPIKTSFGEYRGGYYPAIIDRNRTSNTSVENKAINNVADMKSMGSMFVQTNNGFTKSRVENYADKLTMNLMLVPSHIDRVLKFTHLAPAVKDVQKLILSKEIKAKIRNQNPQFLESVLIPWLQRSAIQRVADTETWLEQMLATARTRTGASVMFLNVSNTLQQYTGIVVGMAKVKPKYIRKAMGQLITGRKALYTSIQELSPFMKTKMDDQMESMAGQIDSLINPKNKVEKVRDFAIKNTYILQSIAQNHVDAIVWHGAYNQALEAGKNSNQAVADADSAVRLTQGSFNPEDVSQFEVGSPAMRLFSLFGGYWNMVLNLAGTEGMKQIKETGMKAGSGRLAYLYTTIFMIPAILSGIIARTMWGLPLDEDDDGDYVDDLLMNAMGDQAKTAMSLVPIVGPTANAAYGRLFTAEQYDDKVNLSPVIQAWDSVAGAPVAAYRILSGEELKKKDVRDLLTAASLATGFPVKVLAKPIGYGIDLESGRANPENALDAVRGFVSGSPGGKQ